MAHGDCGMSFGLGLSSVAVSPRTLQRWLHDPAFVNELTAARTAAFDAAMQSVMAAANTAVDTLLDLVKTKNPPATRLGAARSLLDLGIERHDASTIVARLAELERQVAAQAAR